MEKHIYPLILAPVFKDYIWGGNKLKTNFNKKTDLTPLAESWELAAHKDGDCIIINGICCGMRLSEYAKTYPSAISISHKNRDNFPILIKLIDATDNLSVQVHPDDEYAALHECSKGKTEMWHILDCEPQSFIFLGFKQDVSKEEFKKRIEHNTLIDVLNRVFVKPGDTFFIAPNTLHAIGRGIVLAEIQQNSNITYRIYDYGRKDKNGRSRELHIEKATEITSLHQNQNNEIEDNTIIYKNDRKETNLCSCQYFSVRKIEIFGSTAGTSTDKNFRHLLCTGGTGTLSCSGENYKLSKGDSILMPAGNYSFSISGNLEVLCSEPC